MSAGAVPGEDCLIVAHSMLRTNMLRALSLLLVLGQAASLRLPAVRVESRRSVLGTAAGLLLPLSLPTASHAVSADGTPDPTDDFNEFKEEKAAAMKATKEVSLHMTAPVRLCRLLCSC